MSNYKNREFIKESINHDSEEKLSFFLFSLVPIVCWIALGWYFNDMPIEDYKIFLGKLWALPTALTFLLFMFIFIFTLILRGFKLDITNMINGRHYLKGNFELSNIATSSKQPFRFMLKSLIYMKYVAWIGVGWGTLGALILFILIQTHA